MLRLALGLLVCLAPSCVRLQTAETGTGASKTTVWSGVVQVEDDLRVPRGTRLVLQPGTTVRFAYRDRDGDGWGDLSLTIEGDLIAMGTPAAPVIFTSAAEPAEPGLWGEVRIDFGSFELAHAVVEGSTRGLHSHFSRGSVRDSVFRRNVDGTRFGESTIEVVNCLFYGHPGKAYNARHCRNRVEANFFRQNRNAVFLFDGDGGSSFEGNVFRDNESPFRLGDFFEGPVSLGVNDWGGDPPDTPSATRSARPKTEAEVAQNKVGPRGWPSWREAWRAQAGGFVDAEPVLSEEGVYAVSWSGEVLRLSLPDGAVLGRAKLPDAVDAKPALAAGFLAVPCWDRGIYLLHRPGLAIAAVFRERESPADDHRQSSPVLLGTRLFAATWAGTARAFETSAGRLAPLWSFDAAGPFRAGLARSGNRLLAPCEDGVLYALSTETGQPLWKFQAGAPLLCAPAVDDERVYLADRSGRLHAVRLTSGQSVWQQALRGSAWYAPPLLAEGFVVQGDDSGQLSCFEAQTGRLVWRKGLGAGIRSRPALVGSDRLAVGTAAGRMLLLDLPTGLERDGLQTDGALFSSPLAVDTRVVFGGRDGFVRALDAHVPR